MTNQSDERISSLVDGELDEQERRRTLTAMEADAGLRRQWERYHLASDALRNNLPQAIDTGFAGRVMAALKDEPTVLAPPPSKPAAAHAPLSKRLAGVAVAASVAAVAVLGVQTMYRDDAAMNPQQQLAKAAPGRNSEVLQVAETPANLARTLPAQSVHHFDPYLNKYLLDHNQQAARMGIQGVMPYARIVAYPATIPQDPR
jgi:sigma-E factor negative regulatory protein RseA